MQDATDTIPDEAEGEEQSAPVYATGLADYLTDAKPMTPVKAPPATADEKAQGIDWQGGLKKAANLLDLAINPVRQQGEALGIIARGLTSETVQQPVRVGIDRLMNAAGVYPGDAWSAQKPDIPRPPEEAEADRIRQENADIPVIRSAEAMKQEIGSRVMQLIAQRGEATELGETTREQVGSKVLVQSALEVAQKGTAGGATPEMLDWAQNVLREHAKAQMDSITDSEQGRAELAQGPEDYMRRVTELKGKGFSDQAVAQIMETGKWNSSLITTSALNRLDDEIDILGMQGQFERAARLKLAKGAMLKQGLAPLDANANPGDVLLDQMAKARADTGGRWQAFDAGATNAVVSTVRGAMRLANAIPPESQDRDILERYVNATTSDHPYITAGGELAGGLLDPVFYAFNGALSGIKASEPLVKSFVTSLIEKGTPAAAAEIAGKNLTMEQVAREGMTNYFQRKLGFQDASVARTLSSLVWNSVSGSVAMGASSALQVAPENMTPVQKAIAIASGAGKGALMGLGLGALHIGGAAILERVQSQANRLMLRADPDVPPAVLSAVRNAIDYSANGLDGEAVKEDVSRVIDVVAAARDGIGRKLTEPEIRAALDSHGIDLDYLQSLKVEKGPALQDTIRTLEEKLHQPGIEPEERAAMTATWERAQRMLAEQGAPEQEMAAGKLSPEEAHAQVKQQLLEAEPDASVLDRIRELDKQAQAERGLKGQDLEEYKGLLGQVVSRNLTADFKIRSAEQLEGPLTGNTVRKWESTKDALLRNEQRKAAARGPAKGVRGADQASKLPVADRAQVLEGFRQAFDLPPEQHQAVTAILDAAGATLTKKGAFQSPEEFYSKTFAAPREGGRPGADAATGEALYQKQGDLMQAAKRHFGVTPDPREAGYILPTGEMLDFSGTKGGGGRPGVRATEHRALDEIGLPPTTEGMLRFMGEGAARVDYGAGLVQLSSRMEEPQLRAIAKMMVNREHPMGVYVEITDPSTGRNTFNRQVQTGDKRGIVQALFDANKALEEGPSGVLHQRAGEGGQRIAASVEFVEDGRALIRALERPDITSAFHEIGHVFRRLLEQHSPDDLKVAESWAGVKEGNWTRANEEKFARGWERYLRDGESPVPALRRVFEQLKAWFTAIYRNVKGPLSNRLNPELRDVFDRLLGKEAEGLGGQKTAEPPANVVQRSGPTAEAVKLAEPSAPHTLPPPALRPAIVRMTSDEAKNAGYMLGKTTTGFGAETEARRIIEAGGDAVIAKGPGSTWQVHQKSGATTAVPAAPPAQAAAGAPEPTLRSGTNPPVPEPITGKGETNPPKAETGSAQRVTGEGEPAPQAVPRGTPSRSLKGERREELPPPPISEIGYGREVRLELPDREKPLSGAYAVISAVDAIPSHDARAGFEPNAFGDPNERDYRDPTEGKALRDNVYRMRDKLNPAFLHADTPSAVDGPPVMDPHLRALGGNARTMVQQLVYHEGGEKADFLREATQDAARKFGIDPGKVAAIKDPMIVRILRPEDAGKPGELSRVLNKAFTAARTSDTDAISRGRKLDQGATTKIASLLTGDTTLADVFNDRTRSDELLGHLVGSGAFDRADLIGLTDQRGLLTKEGRSTVERTLLGAAIPDVRRLAELQPQLRGTVIKALPAIIKLRAFPSEPAFDSTLGYALDAIRDYRESGARSLSDLVQQQSMMPQEWREHPRALGLAEALMDDTPTAIGRKLSELAGIRSDEAAGQGQMFGGGGGVARSFDEIFPYTGPDPNAGGGIFGGTLADLGHQADSYMAGSSSPYTVAARIPSKAPAGSPIEVYRDALQPMPMPELLKLARVLGTDPTIRDLGSATTGRQGSFLLKSGKIVIDPIAASNPEGLAKTLAHEIGHGIDWLPDQTIERGNILARVLSLKPIIDYLGQLHGFMRDTFPLASATNTELRNELKQLTRWWRPFNEAAVPPKYVAYRDSAHELYADALSVLLNSPGLLEQRAPKFYGELMQWFDRKPRVFEAYKNLQDLLAGKPEDVIAARRADIREDFASGEQIMRARALENRAADQSVLEYVQQQLWDRAAPIVNREKAAAIEGLVSPDRLAARYAMDEFAMKDNAAHVLLSKVQREVHEPILDGGLTKEDAGEFLMMNRIAAGDRQAFGNPRGHTPDTAAEQLRDLEATLGKEKWATLTASMQRFQEIVFDKTEEGVDEGIYNRQMFEDKIVPNRGFYATFAVLDHLEDYIPAAIRQQIGTFKSIANPYDTTLMKLVSLSRGIELNRAKRIAIAEGIAKWFPDEAILHRPAPGVEPPRPGAGREMLPYMINGRMAFFDVDQYVAKAFKDKDIGNLSRLARAITRPLYASLHPLYVTFSPAFGIANVFRDFKRTYADLPSAAKTKITMADMVRSYIKALPESWKRATEQYHPLIEQMIDDRAIRETPYSKVDQQSEYAGIERLLAEHGLIEQRGILAKVGEIFKPAETVLSFLAKPMHAIQTAVDFTEALPKVAAYQMLGEKGIVGQRRAYLVRNYVGTPNTSRRGLATSLTNGLFLYSNVNIQGLTSDLGLALHPKTAGGWWLRSMFTDFLPKVAMKAATLGLFGGAVAAMMKMIPDYDLSKFICIPVGTRTGDDGKTRTVYFRFPHEDVHRLISSVAWQLMEGKPAKAFSELMGQLPLNPNPYFTMANKWSDYLQGNNPIDDFRNRPIIDQDAFKAGGWNSAEGMLHWTANQFGVASTVFNAFAGQPGESRVMSTKERVLGELGAGTGLGSFFKESDRGLMEAEYAQKDLEDQEKARLKLDLGPDAKALLSERYRLQTMRGLEKEKFAPADAQRLGYVQQWYRDAYLPITKQMTVLKQQKRDAEYQQLAAYLKAISEQIRHPPPSTKGQP